jgi:hypothetical protein
MQKQIEDLNATITSRFDLIPSQVMDALGSKLNEKSNIEEEITEIEEEK